jgi:hypothetical protein
MKVSILHQAGANALSGKMNRNDAQGHLGQKLRKRWLGRVSKNPKEAASHELCTNVRLVCGVPLVVRASPYTGRGLGTLQGPQFGKEPSRNWSTKPRRNA